MTKQQKTPLELAFDTEGKGEAWTDTDPIVRWFGRGEAARLPPIPIGGSGAPAVLCSLPMPPYGSQRRGTLFAYRRTGPVVG
jgi:hypothetical protein